MTREEILQARDNLRKDLENNIKDKKIKNQSIGKIVYYEGFEIANSKSQDYKFAENEVFIVTRNIEEPNGTVRLYEIYDEHETLLARTDSAGKLTYSKEYTDRLKLLTGDLYDKIGLEKGEHYLSREGEFFVADTPYEQMNEQERGEFLVTDKPYKELSEKEKEELKLKLEEQKNKKLDEPERALIEDDLGLNRSDITDSVEITDERFYDVVPEAKQYSGNAMLVYSKKTNQFYIGGIGRKTGKFEQCKRIQKSFTPDENTLDLSADEQHVHEKNIDKYMRIKGEPNYAFAVDITTVGRDPFKMVRIDRNEGGHVKYISSDLQTSNEYRAPKKIENIMSKQKNPYINDETAIFDQKEEDGQADIKDIDPQTRDDEDNWPEHEMGPKHGGHM